jgi:protein-S-isoprenylcysteine O-methyltransferase Ste14
MLTAARIVILLSWLAVFAGWVRQWRRARSGRSERGRTANPFSKLGMAFEFGSFVWLALLRDPAPAYPSWVYMLAAVLAVASAFLGWAAGAHLGAQLRVQAVVTSSHRLITSGPYSIVRHPIYACLFGFLIATGLVLSRPSAFLVAIPMMIVGTEIRLRAEDKLLAQHFGAEFDAYRRRVAAWLPGIR